MNYRRRKFERLYATGQRKCRYCPEDRLELLTLDHIKPLSKGGGWEMSNLAVVCRRCNICKGKMNDAEFRNHIRQIGGIEKLPKHENAAMRFVEVRRSQLETNEARYRHFDEPAADALEKATR